MQFYNLHPILTLRILVQSFASLCQPQMPGLAELCCSTGGRVVFFQKRILDRAWFEFQISAWKIMRTSRWLVRGASHQLDGWSEVPAINFDVVHVSQPPDFGVTYLVLIPLEMMRTRATWIVPGLVCLAGRTVSPCPHFVGRLVRRESTTVCGFSLPIIIWCCASSASDNPLYALHSRQRWFWTLKLIY